MPMMIKLCPRCGDDMTLRWNKRIPFLGCCSWPMCTYTEAIPPDAHMRRLSAPQLPFMEDDDALSREAPCAEAQTNPPDDQAQDIRRADADLPGVRPAAPRVAVLSRRSRRLREREQAQA